MTSPRGSGDRAIPPIDLRWPAKPEPGSPLGETAPRSRGSRPSLDAQAATAQADARRFFLALYGEAPTGHLTLWTGRSKKTLWPASVDVAAQEAVRLGQLDDVYFGVGLRREPLPTGRGGATGSGVRS